MAVVRTRITRLSPLRTIGAEASERYYVTNHIPLIVRLRQAPNDATLRYRPHRVVGEWTPEGSVNEGKEPPTPWRYVFVDYRAGSEPIAPDHAEAIFSDHVHFVQDLETYEVERRVVVDRRSGQLSSVKFLLLGRHDESGQWEETHLDVIGVGPKDASAPRLAVSNRALSRLVTEGITAPGQRYTGQSVAVDEAIWFDELYFDNAWEADRYLQARIGEFAAEAPDVRVLAVEELVALDRSGTRPADRL